MNCNQCGTSNPAGVSDCLKCGAALGLAAPPAMRAEPELAGRSPGGAVDVEAWKAVLGPRNQAYYLSRFLRMAQGGPAARWHWPACLVTWYWLLYRKLWLWALLYFFLPYLLALGIGLVAGQLLPEPVAGAVTFVAYLGLLFVVPPLLANGVYYRACQARMRQLAAISGSREQYLARLEAQGGTSAVLLVVFGVIMAVALIGILAAVAIPAYQDYTHRAKVAAALADAEQVARAVGTAYEADGRLPELAALRERLPPPSPHLQDLEMNPDNGQLLLTVRLGPQQSLALRLLPAQDANRRVIWHCRGEPAQARWLPPRCRP